MITSKEKGLQRRIKQAVFENAKELDNLRPLKILKACRTRWLTHGETLACIVNHFKEVLTTLDTLVTQKKDEEAKGIRDQLSPPNSIMYLIPLWCPQSWVLCLSWANP